MFRSCYKLLCQNTTIIDGTFYPGVLLDWKFPSTRFLHCCLSFAALKQVAPCHYWEVIAPSSSWTSSCSFPVLTYHSVHRTVHLLSFMRATWPAHFHLVFVMISSVSLIPVFSVIVLFGILSICFIHRIFLSIFLWHISILWTSSFGERWKENPSYQAKDTKQDNKR